MWGNSVKIVIVDDQTSARTMLRHILEDISPELQVLDFSEEEGRLVAAKIRTADPLRDVFGILDLGRPTDEVMDELRGPSETS